MIPEENRVYVSTLQATVNRTNFPENVGVKACTAGLNTIRNSRAAGITVWKLVLTTLVITVNNFSEVTVKLSQETWDRNLLCPLSTVADG